MKARLSALMLCAVLLAGCQSGGEGVSAASSLPPEPTPKTVRELLEEQPIDDTHDAFLVDTGGRMGTLLVTTGLGTERGEFEVSMSMSVWDPADMSRPLQTQNWGTLCFGVHEVLDVNFDGYQDFTYLFARGVQAEGYHCMVWDEEQGLFAEEPEYAAISSPVLDPETQTIRGWNRESAAGDGVSTIHQWVDGELVCVRRIEVYKIDGWGGPFALMVEDRVDGKLTEVFRTEFPAGSEEYFDESVKWNDLSYHGETGER